MSDFKMWEEVKEWLAQGESVSVHVWYFSQFGMSCGDGCCDDYYIDVDAALESVRYYAHTIERVEKW